VHRDSINQFPTRKVAAAATARFTYLAETIAKAYEPTQTQLEELERAYNATGQYLSDCAEFAGMLMEVHAHGSRQLGTIVRPMDALREGFDIDLIARLTRVALSRYGGDGGTALLIEHLFQALKRYADRHGLKIKRWERCVTLTYAGGMCADFAPVIDDPTTLVTHGQHHSRIPDRELKRYLATNPRGYCMGFDEIARISPRYRHSFAADSALESFHKAEVAPLPDSAEVLGRPLSRFVQLGKIHRNVAFAGVSGDLAPTSVFVTSLFAKAYSIAAPQMHEGPLDLMFDMVEMLPTLFAREQLGGGREHWTLVNPCAHGDNLASSMNDSQRQQAFLQWHAKLRHDLDKLLDAIDGAQGLDEVHKVVEHAFGPRAAQAAIQRGAERRDSNRTLKRAGFVVAGTLPVVQPARAHTYFGGPAA
jgi:Second Messenger Oligonucleotide or Dinucleotide Synthetase domain